MTFELPSGLPEGPWSLGYEELAREDPEWFVEKTKQRLTIAAEIPTYALARAIASIPDMVEEIGSKARIIEVLDKENTRLCEQIGDIQTLLDAAIAGLADNERLRALNAEMRESLNAMWLIATNGHLTPEEDTACDKAMAILAKSQEAP